MSIVLLALGVLTAAAGAVMVGFGVPINEFSLGNTLIIAGTTALVGGLIVIGLAIASRNLVQIATLLRTQPVAPRPRPAEGYEQPAQAHPAPQARAPFPPKHPQESGRDMLPQPESGFAPPEVPADPIFERLRMNAHAGQPPLAPAEEAPLSPRVPRIPPFAPEPPAHAEPPARPAEYRAPPKQPAAPAEAPEKTRPHAGASQSPRSAFNEAWPEPGQPPRTEPPAARPEPPRPNGDDARAAREPEAAPVSILKSGVVDGMAYTLYTDGSIEAELAHGVVRFGSIEELRNHLEKNS